MSEELNEGQGQEQPAENQNTEIPQHTEAELSAIEQGWKPKDQFEGDESKWVPADEFLRRGELFGKIDSMSKELKDTKKALRMLQEHHMKVREAEYKHAIEDLRAEKRKALEEGDADRLIEIDEQIAEHKASAVAEKQQAQQVAQQPDPRFLAWVNDNKWYAENKEMRAMADEVGMAYARSNPEDDPSEVLKYVASRIKKAYPEQFTNPNRTRQNSVEGSSAHQPGKKSDDFELTEEERKAMNTFVRQGILTKEAYIAELKKVKGL